MHAQQSTQPVIGTQFTEAYVEKQRWFNGTKSLDMRYLSMMHQASLDFAKERHAELQHPDSVYKPNWETFELNVEIWVQLNEGYWFWPKRVWHKVESVKEVLLLTPQEIHFHVTLFHEGMRLPME